MDKNVPFKKRKIVLEENQALKLTDLNDACLIRLCFLLDTKDLIQLSAVHRRFHAAIKCVLPTHRIQISAINVKHLERFFKIFGDSILNLDIDVREKPFLKIEFIESLIHNYCKNVVNCRIAGFRLRREFIANNERFFKSLKSLLLENVVIKKKDCGALLNVTSELHELVTCNFPYDVNELLEKMANHKCKVLGLQNMSIDGTRLQNMPILSNVEVLTVSSQQPFIAIFKYFPNVKKLVLHRDCLWDCLGPILNLQSLKQLTLWFYASTDHNIELFFSELGQSIDLDTLNVGLIELDNNDIVKHICEIQNLKELELDSKSPFNNYVLHFACKLKELQSFRFYDHDMYIRNAPFNEQLLFQFITFAKKLQFIEVRISNVNGIDYKQVYERLLTIVQGRESLLQINIIDKFNSPFYMENQWLKMTVKPI